jgi:hypothetical protein
MIYLRQGGLSINQAVGDADTEIVKVALNYAWHGTKAVAMLAQDTDI